MGPRADAYLEGSAPASCPEMEGKEQGIRGGTPKRLRNIGWGGGHVGYRMGPHAAEVMASDLSIEMIAAVVREAAQRYIGNSATVKAAAESLPFDSGHFDAVVSRFSAHHWGDLTGGQIGRAHV